MSYDEWRILNNEVSIETIMSLPGVTDADIDKLRRVMPSVMDDDMLRVNLVKLVKAVVATAQPQNPVITSDINELSLVALFEYAQRKTEGQVYRGIDQRKCRIDAICSIMLRSLQEVVNVEIDAPDIRANRSLFGICAIMQENGIILRKTGKFGPIAKDGGIGFSVADIRSKL